MIYTKEMLDEARAAYFRISTGQSVAVVIDQNGERIEFQKGNLTALADLIRKMEMEMEMAVGTTSAYRPLRTFF